MEAKKDFSGACLKACFSYSILVEIIKMSYLKIFISTLKNLADCSKILKQLLNINKAIIHLFSSFFLNMYFPNMLNSFIFKTV